MRDFKEIFHSDTEGFVHFVERALCHLGVSRPDNLLLNTQHAPVKVRAPYRYTLRENNTINHWKENIETLDIFSVPSKT